MFKNRTYMAIPAVMAVADLKNLFESFPDFGYVSISKSGECAKYSYSIEWLSRGPQPLISITNTSALIPTGSPANVSLIQNGTFQNQYYVLPIDLMRTYHTIPQVTFIFSLYPCRNLFDCRCRWKFLSMVIHHSVMLKTIVVNFIIHFNKHLQFHRYNTIRQR